MKTLEELKESLVKIIDSEIKKYEQEQAKPVFEVGKWYKENNGNKMWFIQSLDGREQMSFGFSADGIWQPLTQRHSTPSEFHMATPTEIHEALKKEAVKRGFVEGAKCVWDGGKIDVKLPFKVTYFGLETNNEFIIMDNKGQWATVQKEQPLMIGGYEVKFCSDAIVNNDTIKALENYTTIDGNRFDKKFWQAAKLISQHSKAKIMVGCSKQFDVSLELINKILEKLK